LPARKSEEMVSETPEIPLPSEKLMRKQQEAGNRKNGQDKHRCSADAKKGENSRRITVIFGSGTGIHLNLSRRDPIMLLF